MRSVFATTVLMAVLVSMALGCMHACKKFKETKLPGCDLEGDGCKCLFGKHYQVSLKDPTTGETGQSGWTDKNTAGDEAVFKLFQKDRGCNCVTNSSIPLGSCIISAKACYFFASTQAVKSASSSFQLYAQVTSPSPSSQFTASAANKTAVPAAALGLLTQIEAFNPQCSPSAIQRSAAVAFLQKQA